MKKLSQIITVLFSLSLLGGYVVFSQQQQQQQQTPQPSAPDDKKTALETNQPASMLADKPSPTPAFAPGSKSLAPLVPVQPPRSKGSMRQLSREEREEIIASSSKSKAPLILFSPKTNPAAAKNIRVAPGSKSATVFHLPKPAAKEMAPAKKEVVPAPERPVVTPAGEESTKTEEGRPTASRPHLEECSPAREPR